MDALIVYPPLVRRKKVTTNRPSIFLGGSIEMGKAEDWQTRTAARLIHSTSIIYNPRRPDWDSSWEQDINNEQFNVQVNWELDRIGEADIVVMYFDPATKSAISLMEVGILSVLKPAATHVCCPEGFWRKGNVDILCERSGIITHESLDDMLNHIDKLCVRMSSQVDKGVIPV